MSADLAARWRALAGGAEEVGARLIAAYGEPQRRYHGQGHVRWLLEELDRRAGVITDAACVGYAIWFHDAIYDPTRGDNEELSAQWAERELAVLAPKLASPVAALIRRTKNHMEGDASGDEALFLDMDMAILGAPRVDYVAYAAAVRAEYGHAPDAAFIAGRGAFLDAQLARSRLFRTDIYETECAAIARANMAFERAELAKGKLIVP